jgi:two-component system chemotaxis sensor kinase CheA
VTQRTRLLVTFSFLVIVLLVAALYLRREAALALTRSSAALDDRQELVQMIEVQAAVDRYVHQTAQRLVYPAAQPGWALEREGLQGAVQELDRLSGDPVDSERERASLSGVSERVRALLRAGDEMVAATDGGRKQEASLLFAKLTEGAEEQLRPEVARVIEAQGQDAIALLAEQEQALKEANLAGMVTLALVLGAVTVGGAGLLLGLTRGIRNLSEGAARIAHGDLATQIPEGADEFGTVARAFNAMALEVQSSQNERAARAAAEEASRLQAQFLANLQLVLDNIGDGLLAATLDGKLLGEHSRPIRDWFGAPRRAMPIWEYFAATDATFADWLRLGWEAISEDVLPFELVLSQLPRRLEVNRRSFEVHYQPVSDGADQPRILIIVTDITERVGRERMDAMQRETVNIFSRIMADRAGFIEFFDEITAMVKALGAHPCLLSEEEILRTIHTIKGNAAIFGVSSVAEVCHQVESQCAELACGPSREDRQSIVSIWEIAAQRVLELLGERQAHTIEIEEAEYLLVLQAIRTERSRDQIARMISRWKHEPTQLRLVRMAQQARTLAARLGVEPVEVQIEHNQVRLPRGGLAPFWSALVHVVRNAVDHGLRSVESGSRRLVLRSFVSDGRTVVSVTDNGHGIAWETVRQRASRQGLPAETHEDLVQALFADGLSSREEATEMSGRGVGLAAVASTCAALGVEIHVSAEEAGGTTFAFVLPTQISALAA